MDLVERSGSLARQGLSDAQIATRLGIHRDTATKKRVQAGLRRPHTVITTDQEQMINRLADDGVSVNEIARTVGLSWPAVAKRRPDAVWSSRDAAAWGRMHRTVGHV